MRKSFPLLNLSNYIPGKLDLACNRLTRQVILDTDLTVIANMDEFSKKVEDRVEDVTKATQLKPL